MLTGYVIAIMQRKPDTGPGPLSWYRPYVALCEQNNSKTAVSIIPVQDEYILWPSGPNLRAWRRSWTHLFLFSITNFDNLIIDDRLLDSNNKMTKKYNIWLHQDYCFNLTPISWTLSLWQEAETFVWQYFQLLSCFLEVPTPSWWHRLQPNGIKAGELRRFDFHCVLKPKFINWFNEVIIN